MARTRGCGWSRLARLASVLLAFGVLTGCNRKANDAHQPPVPIRDGDTSATCGMYITHYPGPRGEAYIVGAAAPLKFGSTRDVFSFVTRPDVEHRLGAVYVQDTAQIDWAHPSNAASSFIDARKAFYVAWQPQLGDMGPTFGSFAKRSDAEAFIRRYGGAVLSYAQITPKLVLRLTAACPVTGSPLSAMAREAGCTTGASASLATSSHSSAPGGASTGVPK